MAFVVDLLENETSLLVVNKHLLLAQKPSAEDKGIVAVSGFLANQPDHFWAGIVGVQLMAIVWFLAQLQNSDRRENLSVFQAIPIAVLWASIGIFLIIFNKLLYLPAGSGFGFPYAVFLMWWHALMGTISTNVLRLVRPSMIPAVADQRLSWYQYFVNVVPVAGLQGFGLAFGNLAYLYISVAYIQMVKNTMSAFVYMFSILLALERGTYASTFAVTMVVAGLVLTSVGEDQFSMIGFCFILAAVISDALRLALTKIILSGDHAVKLDPISALYYAAPTICVLLTVPMLLVDGPKITSNLIWDLKFVLVSNAFVAFGLNVTSMFFIKRCGPTTYALTGVVKDIALILISCVAFGHPVTAVQFAGFLVSLVGFQLYNRLKEDQAYLEKLCSTFGFSMKSADNEETTPLIGEQLLTAKEGAEHAKGP